MNLPRILSCLLLVGLCACSDGRDPVLKAKLADLVTLLKNDRNAPRGLAELKTVEQVYGARLRPEQLDGLAKARQELVDHLADFEIRLAEQGRPEWTKQKEERSYHFHVETLRRAREYITAVASEL